MTREELEHIHTTTLQMIDTPERATLKSYIFRLINALENDWAWERERAKCETYLLRAAWADRDTYDTGRGAIMREELARLRQVCRHSLTCLYLGAVEEVADDVKDKVIAYTDALEQKVRELERGEYICKKCGLRKDSDPQPADF